MGELRLHGVKASVPSITGLTGATGAEPVLRSPAVVSAACLSGASAR